jgi:hypothetical protein
MRQKRDKTRSAKPDGGKYHRGVLILPAGMRANYKQQMMQCKAAWREGEPLAVAEAQTRTHIYQQTIPAWLERAVVELAMVRRTKQQAKDHHTLKNKWRAT